MIIYVSRWDHGGTVASFRSVKGVARLSYDQLLSSRRFRKGCYIFSDLDRLGPWELELAARAYQNIQREGCPALNDPARVLHRFELLRRLYDEGINAFNAWRPGLGEWPDRYPVFLRRDAFHSGVLSELLQTRAELESAWGALLREGIPAKNLIAVEYAAEPADGDIFRKFAVHRIGDRFVQETSVNQRHWTAKEGDAGCAGEAFYRAELEGMRTVPHEDLVRRVFNLAAIEYGRMDFGLVGGRPQIYEINTNPTVSFGTQTISPARSKSREIFVENFRAALTALEPRATKGSLPVRDKYLRRFRTRARWPGWRRPSL